MDSLDGKVKRNQKFIIMIVAGALLTIFISYYVLGEITRKQDVQTLRMVLVLFRHGEKTPTSFYPNDPYRKHPWAGGLGALTQKGRLQAYNLGTNLRARYNKLLPRNGIYSQHNMLVLSSAAERCLMSAQCMVAGFAPPLVETNTLPIPWQPIPINCIPRKEDILLAQKKPCLKYDSLLKKMYETPPFDLKQLNEQYAEVYEFVSNKTGKNISNVLEVELLYNTLKTEDEHELQLPDWTEQVYPNVLKPLAERSYIVFTETDFMKKIRGGAFLREVVNRMKTANIKNENDFDRKIFFYSGHDVTIVNILNSLGIVNQTDSLPQFCSALAFELHENLSLSDGLEVKISYYKNSTAVNPKDVFIPNCSAPCSLEHFIESINALLFDDYDEICENSINKLK